MAEEKKKSPKKKSQQKVSPPMQYEYNDYLLFLHKKKVEVHINYGGSVLKLEGTIRTKARYDVQLILDSGEILNINKGYIILVKPIEK